MEMAPDEAKLALECLLFVGNEPLPESLLMDIMEVDRATLREAIDALGADLETRSLQIVEVAGGLRMMTRPKYHRYVERLFEPQPTRISRAGLECLAIVAYRQPITRPEIDAIRGVNSSGSMESLLRKGLIKEVGRKDVPGRPILYATTQSFLEVAGLKDLKELPSAESGIPADLLARIPVEPDPDVEIPFEAPEDAPPGDEPEGESPAAGDGDESPEETQQ
jgi:segregation and condensation protein B